VRVLSEIQPKTASEAASMKILIIWAVEIRPGATPRNTLKTWKASDA